MYRLVIFLFLLNSFLLIADERLIIHQGIEREFILHVPESANQDSALVFVIHGYSSSAEEIQKYSGMNEIADREGFIVVYPQGTIDQRGIRFFNVGFEFHKDSPIDDVSFIRSLVELLKNELGLRRKKAFATGMSNGGDMSYMLACTSSDLFRAVAPVAGTLMKHIRDNCNIEDKVSLFEIHGTDDEIAWFDGDISNRGGWGAYLDLPSTMDFFAMKNNLDLSSTTQIRNIDEGSSYNIFFKRYWKEGFVDEVWLYKIDKGRHVWPGLKMLWWKKPIRYYLGSGNKDLDASEEVWLFFRRLL